MIWILILGLAGSLLLTAKAFFTWTHVIGAAGAAILCATLFLIGIIFALKIDEMRIKQLRELVARLPDLLPVEAPGGNPMAPNTIHAFRLYLSEYYIVFASAQKDEFRGTYILTVEMAAEDLPGYIDGMQSAVDATLQQLNSNADEIKKGTE